VSFKLNVTCPFDADIEVVNATETLEELYVFLICASAEYEVKTRTSPAAAVTATVIVKSVPWSIYKFAIIAI
jgi:hypothetical protein